jgi:hypothetical protein
MAANSSSASNGDHSHTSATTSPLSASTGVVSHSI